MVAETMPATSDAVPLLGKLFASILSNECVEFAVTCVRSRMSDFISMCLISRGILSTLNKSPFAIV